MLLFDKNLLSESIALKHISTAVISFPAVPEARSVPASAPEPGR